jgi:hypothetical protein
MRKVGLLWAILGALGLGFFVQSPAVAADDPPALRAPGDDPQGRPDSTGNLPGMADIRRDGPPVNLPSDPVGPAPGPGFFFIPGQYVPAGDGVSWRPGFWARSQPGWEWVPARWVRLAEGWTYREGHWERATRVEATPPIPAREGRPELGPTTNPPVVQPLPGPLSPFSPGAATVEREPDPSTPTDLQPIPEGGLAPTPERGPIVTPGAVAQPVPGPNRNPNPNLPPGGMSANPPILDPNPFVPYPGISINLPVTEVFLPNGMNIKVVPGQLPRFTRSPFPFAPGLPQVQVRPWSPMRDLR